MAPARPVAALLALIAASSAALGDDLFVSRAGSFATVPLQTNVTILRIEGSAIVYRTPAGIERSEPLTDIARLTVSDDPKLTAADDAYTRSLAEPEPARSAALDVALRNYAAVLDQAPSWKQAWAAPRLLAVAEKTHRFEAALRAYVVLAETNPRRALDSKPKLPSRGRYLDDAAKVLDAAAKTATTELSRQALLSLLLDVHTARGDAAGIASVGDRIAKPAAAGDPTLSIERQSIATAAGDARLAQARNALAAGRPDDALTAVAPDDAFVDPKQLIEAMKLRATAESGRAVKDGSAGAHLDAALAWLRLVAAPDAEPADAEPALLAAADELRAAGDADGARRLLEQLAASAPESQFGRTAADRLRASP